MNTKQNIQLFNKKNRLYNVIYNYIIRMKLIFNGKNISELSKNNVKHFVEDIGIKLNSQLIKDSNFRLTDGDEIEIPDFNINFIAKIDSDYQDIEEIEILSELDTIIFNYLNNKLGTSTLNELGSDKTKLAFALIIILFDELGFDQIKESKFSYELTNFIKSAIIESKIAEEIKIPKSQLNFSGKLISILTNEKREQENRLKVLNENLINGHYHQNLFKYLQDYRKIFSTDSFQYLINPFLEKNLSSPIILENLIKLVHKSISIEGIDDKFKHYDLSKPIYVSYFENLKCSDKYNNEFYHASSEYLFKLLKIHCETAVEKAARITIEPTNRKYNFSNVERINQEIYLIITNTGEGLAKYVSISSLSNNFIFEQLNVGILKPNESREISVISNIKYDSHFKPNLLIHYQWEEISGKQYQGQLEVEFQIQQLNIPWEYLRKLNPYANVIIDDANKLYGRREILEELRSNIMSDIIESYKLWGQKRVGKSSIVKTLKSLLDNEEKVILVYRSVGVLKNVNPVTTLNTIGESICIEIYEELDKKIRDSSTRQRLRGIQVPAFNGSLFPLDMYIKQLKKVDDSLKFVFILDEFDRINDEFFLPGPLGETFSLSIGKGLNENNYIGFILVCSENMHLLDRQGMNYNSYQEKEVDTFDKQKEYNSFIQIIKNPVAPYLNYSDEAIEKIFYTSNGNPYFANLICANVFKIAYNYKDNEINTHTINEAISIITNSYQKSHFEHFWGDGITDEINIKKERKSDIRRRVLVSYSMTSDPSENIYPNRQEIARKFKFPIESEYEIEKYEIDNTITEFFNRKIFVISENNQIRILPFIFESWLCGKGKTLMIEGVSDLEELQREIDLEKERALKPDELNRLSENFHFKDKKISVEKFTHYFKQFGGALAQRRIFKLLDSIYFLSKEEIVNFYRKESKNIFSKLDIHLKEKVKTIYREGLELYTFTKYYSENLEVIESFKIHNYIKKQKPVKTIIEDPLAWKKNTSDEIIILEPIIDKFVDIQEELTLLINDDIRLTKVSIRLVTFVITTKAKTDLIIATSTLKNFKLIAFKEVDETKIKPFIEGTELFENIEESNQTFFEVRKLFPNTSKESLLVLFEDFCPSKSCPILWHGSSHFSPLFHNKFGQLEISSESKDGEIRRDKLYQLSKELSQKINRYIVNYLKAKAHRDGESDWFILKYIPRNVFDNVTKKWLDEQQSDPKEAYFDFIDYKVIIKNINDSELNKIFMIGEKDQYEWMNKCNSLRRDPAHPEKPSPTIEEVEYFEKICNKIIPKLI